MGASMRSNIRVGLRHKARASRRLEWDAMAYLAQIDDKEALAHYINECELKWLNAAQVLEET